MKTITGFFSLIEIVIRLLVSSKFHVSEHAAGNPYHANKG